MNNEKKPGGFSFTYSAKEQEEVKAIREKYIAPEKKEETSIERLRRLDAAVTKKGTVLSLMLGIIGALIMGFGMSLAMSKLSEILGSNEGLAMLIGIPIGIIGIALVALAYPVYVFTNKKEREKIAPEIIRLTDELMR